jgi:hypothetical protein
MNPMSPTSFSPGRLMTRCRIALPLPFNMPRKGTALSPMGENPAPAFQLVVSDASISFRSE